MPPYTHTLARNAPLLHPPCLPSGGPPAPSPRWGQTPEGLPAASSTGPGPALMLLARPVHRGLVGDASLPVYCALAPPRSAGPQSHRGPRAWPLHPENLRPHPLPGASTPQLGWDLREYPGQLKGLGAGQRMRREVGGRETMVEGVPLSTGDHGGPMVTNGLAYLLPFPLRCPPHPWPQD